MRFKLTVLPHVVYVFPFLTSACVTPHAAIRAPQPDGVSTVGWNVMHELAATELSCTMEQLTTKMIEEKSSYDPKKWSFEISGCGNTEIAAIVQGYGATIYSDIDLRKKLKFTFGEKCPKWTVEFIDVVTRGVTACEQKLVYVLSSSGWVANTVADENGKAQ